MRKGEIAHYKQFLLFSQCFLPYVALIFHFNSLPNEKNLDWSKLKTLADNKINVNQKLKFDTGRVENIVGKGENADYHHFLLYCNVFKKAFF